MVINLDSDNDIIKINNQDYTLNLAGSGANAKVYYIKGFENDKYVIKILTKVNKDCVERLRREVNILLEIKGKLDVRVPEVKFNGIENNYYIMERHTPLKNKIEEIYEWDINKKLDKLIDLLKVIKELHENGIYHRDIKQDNILVDENDNFILCDFGIMYDKKQESITLDKRPGNALLPEIIRDEFEFSKKYGKEHIFDSYLVAIFIWEVLNKEKWVKENKHKNFDDYSYNMNITLNEGVYNELKYNKLSELFKVTITDDPSSIMPIDICIELLSGSRSSSKNKILIYRDSSLKRVEPLFEALEDKTLTIDGVIKEFRDYEVKIDSEGFVLTKRIISSFSTREDEGLEGIELNDDTEKFTGKLLLIEEESGCRRITFKPEENIEIKIAIFGKVSCKIAN